MHTFVMEILDDLKDKCETHASKLMQINSDAMVLEMHVGLALEGVSNLKMITSYVSNLFTGYANMSFYQKIPNNI
ncbi:hypothetical protein ZOSMA_323G00120 [Zostera marina]|uniref:Uncharacterized protein n=1 Tax=Zostera marina TaxID=29655 RepID=A0A0K9P8N5_ZOSMR|nr:hypothetical protein ZOSMA_323G00120 [Zostera marina]